MLWLIAAHPDTRRNLMAEAQSHAVAPERLIFAERTPQRADHHARLGLADLFLDTTPYGGHATVNDMLWAGVPVVTCLGRSFASRVAASQLAAIGLSHLVAPDLAAYEALVLDLVRSPPRLAQLRQTLIDNRAKAPLFDMQRLCRHVEAAYRTMWNVHQSGGRPQSFTVQD